MEIKTERLLIRLYKMEDMNDVFEIYSNPTVCTYLLYDAWTDSIKEEKFQKKCNNIDLPSLSLACQLNHKVIGDIIVWNTDMKDTVEIGYVFNQNYHHKGYASEAMKAVVKYLFANYHIHRIQANLDARNIASANVCEKIGMRKEAHFIKDYWNKGEWTDSFVYGMLKEDL